MNSRKMATLINNYKLHDRKKIKDFIIENPESLSLKELSSIAEKVNNQRA
ncbi:DNA methyltransferase, partial [Staphylococcus pseudintermedius]|nr:DNA methyltransferase [Staphylococcus pseudintermedius]